MAEAGPPPRPRVAVFAELIDALEAADLLAFDTGEQQARGDSFFYEEGDAWAGWWTDEALTAAWSGGLDVQPLAVRAIRRLPLLQRVALLLADVAGLTLEEAATITQYPVPEHRTVLDAARQRVIALIDASAGREAA